MKKAYVLDTNVLLLDANALFSFDDNDLIVPMVVLEELDRHKTRSDEAGRNARLVNRTLDDLRKLGNFAGGIPLPTGGTVRIASIDAAALQALPAELQATKVDNAIIAFMLGLKATNPDAVLVSKDINVRIKCDSLGIRCDDYLKMRITSGTHDFYTGVEVVELSETLVDRFYADKQLELSADVLGNRQLYPNQIVVIKHVKDGMTARSAITKCTDAQRGLVVPVTKIETAYGLKPRNKEQTFSLDLLFDDSIKLVTLSGASGCGKTLLTLAAGLEQLKGLGSSHMARYDKLIVSRPVLPVGRDIGFLPGTLEEKMEPWIAPIRDNLNHLMGNKKTTIRSRRSVSQEHGKPRNDEGTYLSMMMDRGLIEIEAIAFIRGRSIPNAFIIVDECQNLSVHELKTIITRAGDGTKIVLTGDIEQIDNSHVDVFTNGLTYAIERFKEQDIAGHVTLLKGERSPLATIASKIL